MSEKKKDAWEEKAPTWDLQAEDPDNKFTRFVHFAAERIKQHLRGGKVLDVGCGPGLLARKLAKLGFDVYGTDLSEQMIDTAVARLSGTVESPALRFRVCRDGEIPFEGETFDLITALQLFPYIEKYTPYIAKLASFLAPGGLIVASNTNRFSLLVMLLVGIRLVSHPRREAGAIRNLVRTGYFSGGYVDYHAAEQAYSASKFDAKFTVQGFKVVDSMDWFHIRRLDRDPLSRRGINKFLARRLGWYHVGVYRKAGSA